MKKFVWLLRHSMELLYGALLCFSSSAYFIVIYLIYNKIVLTFVPEKWVCVSYVLYLLVPIAIAKIVILISKFLPKCAMDCKITEVELANHSFLPNYLGYFFVALSIQDFVTFIFVYVIVFVFTYISQSLCFNPMFLLLGYHFYFVTGEDGTKIFFITKQKMKPVEDVLLDNLRRINDFTFIDMR